MSYESLPLIEKLHENIAIDTKLASNYKMIATGIITTCTVIYSGKPFLTYAGDPSISQSDNLHKLWNLITNDFEKTLGITNLKHLMDLYPRSYNDVIDNTYLSAVITPNKDALTKLKELSSEEFAKYMFLAKVDINRYGDGINYQLYKSISFFNHSCVPNCLVLSDPETGAEIYVVATRIINPGEELTICYNPKYICDNTSHRRNYILSSKYFNCECLACHFQKEFPTLNDYKNQLSIFKKIESYRYCYYCGRDDVNLLGCSTCHIVMYCSKDCQKIHWKQNHKIYCKLLTRKVK